MPRHGRQGHRHGFRFDERQGATAASRRLPGLSSTAYQSPRTTPARCRRWVAPRSPKPISPRWPIMYGRSVTRSRIELFPAHRSRVQHLDRPRSKSPQKRSIGAGPSSPRPTAREGPSTRGRKASHKPVKAGEKAADARVLRIFEELGGRAALDDDPIAHERDEIGDLMGEGDLMGDNDHRLARSD